MKMNHLLSLGLIVLGISCSGTRENQPTVAEATVTPVEFDEEIIIGNTLQIEKLGNLLAVSDTKADSALHIIDLSRRKYVGQFGRKGSGPGEIGRIALLSSTDSGFIISEPLSNRATLLTLSEDGKNHSYRPLMATETSFWYLIKLANGNYLTSEGYVDYPELFKILSPDGRDIAHIGDRQVPERARRFPPIATTAAYQYSPYISPDGSKVFAMGNGEAGAFYKVDGDTVKLISQFFNPAAEADHQFADGDYRGQSGKVPMGFVAAAVSNDAVYVINSELGFDDVDENSYDYMTGKVIYLYDWEGNRKGEIHTDLRLRHITPPDADGIMYGLTEDGCEPTIVSFTIPESLR